MASSIAAAAAAGPSSSSASNGVGGFPTAATPTTDLSSSSAAAAATATAMSESALLQQLPIFDVERVQLQFSIAADFVSAQVANNVMVLALGNGRILRIDLNRPEDIDGEFFQSHLSQRPCHWDLDRHIRHMARD